MFGREIIESHRYNIMWPTGKRRMWDCLFFTYNMVFNSILTRVCQKYLCCFNYLSGYIRVHMRWYLILHVVHIVVTRMI